MKKLLTFLFLTFIVALAVVTRLYKLGAAPAGLYVDEAGQSYSAYSILKTGKDEFGKPFPIVFRSLTDFKTPVYIYLIVPLIPIFGLNAFTVRFPSFFFSVLTIPVLYLLIKELSGKRNLALTGSLLLAISPWHILFGRTNFECNVALFFFLSGVLFFYKAFKKPYFLLVSTLMFAIAIPAYHSQRVITPLMLIILFLRYRKIIFSEVYKPYLIGGFLIGLIISIPTILVSLTPGFLARATGLNIFSHVRQMPAGFLSTFHGILSPLVNGSWFLSTREFLSLYLSYFSPRYMFVLGDYGPRSSFPDLSTFFVWQFPFYIWGLYILIKNKNLGNLRFFTLATLLISPIPGAVTRDPYSTIRALPLVIPQIIIISLGILDLYGKIKKKNMKTAVFLGFLFVIIYSFFKLYSSIIILNEFYRAKYWDSGWQEAVNILKDYSKTNVIVDNSRGDPYLHLAFFLAYDPEKFQEENKEVGLNDYYTDLKRLPEKHIGNIVTRPINWERDLLKDQMLVGDELAISLQQIQIHHLTLIKEIKYPNGEVAIRVVRTSPSIFH